MANATKVYAIDPLQDRRWPEFLEKHRLATLFHSPEWLGALQKTYGYRAIALTTSAPGEPLTSALVACRVRSWLTGRRLVSLPFSDHCTPLIESEEDFGSLLAALKQEQDNGREKYLEIRALAETIGVAGLAGSTTFCLHQLDLRPSLSALYRAFHPSCIRRKIARAEREGLIYEEGISEELLKKFYHLAILTRRRHQRPPQPLSWFRNLITCMGKRVKIRLASQRGEAVAGILTIRYKSTMTYKYGCSDERFHKIGPMQLLMWTAIQEAKNTGLLSFDMGRTEWNNEGLLRYKDRWASERSTLIYLRHPESKVHESERFKLDMAKRIVSLAPDFLLASAGRILYRHIA